MSSTKLKVAFVGQRTYFQSATLQSATHFIEPYFLDFRSGADQSTLLAKIKQSEPDVIIFFRPEILPESTFSNIKALKIGWFTEPIPRINQQSSTQQYDHPLEKVDTFLRESMEKSAEQDLERRLIQTQSIDQSQFDLFISYNPLINDTFKSYGVPIWKSLPLPVSDFYFNEPKYSEVPPRMGFFGRATSYRNRYLNNYLHEFDIRFLAHGVFGKEMKFMFDNLDIGINIHNERYPNFENRVSLHLATGHLVLSEPLSPAHGLEAGSDFLEFNNPTEFEILLKEVWQYPDSFMHIRISGRQKAEYFRASKVYEKLLRELIELNFIPNRQSW